MTSDQVIWTTPKYKKTDAVHSLSQFDLTDQVYALVYLPF